MIKASPPAAPLRVLIIGSGFGGMGLAIQLQKAGISDFLLLEKAAEVGGTWRDNRYPGAACDVPSHLYSFSFEPKTDWSRKFAPQAEIFAYLKHCSDKYGLRGQIRFNTEVAGAEFDESLGLWRVTSVAGEVFTAQALVSACGQLNRPAYPRIPGLQTFQGEAFHSARWNHAYDLRGKRVAVIGTGASAIQFIPEIAPQVAQLHLFQRSAAYVIAKPDRAYRPWELAVMRRLPGLQKLDRMLKYIQHESRVLAFSTFPPLMRLMKFAFRLHLARGIKDSGLRHQMTPDYPMGCKRILISNDYYPALARPNVAIVNDGISAVTERGVVTADGREREVDAIIYGTGFAATDFLAPMQIKGLGGRELNQAWKEGAEAYLGISVSGFPNLFILYGPNTNLGHNSIIYMLESQFPYVLSCIKQLAAQGLRYLDVKPAVQQAFNQRLQKVIHHSIWEQGCTSWYKTAAGKNTNNWPGFTFTYRQHTRAPELKHYDCIR
ncbi:NAD(P)/FAD-dependent oxidoreductase [Pseudomonas cavernicola]|uniref:NAD(P)/FAD-dependent oxidoreductase n=1 Tax=Pseudomonas cavernicola TaxID=2320866 RepID=A0A418XLV4_9PSED|nr:NAD(P)/FAD-dependent oxidoreductase [Pseudomonas cavernicola]RJG13452.1 NAD(P)/FAD-dependent oxidoreductase [Pseudomonas cavernicola]